MAIDASELAWIRAVGERALKPDRAGTSLELVMHQTRPDQAILKNWLAASGVEAIVRVGLPRKFLDGREFGHRDGSRSYLIRPEEILALNRALTSSIEVVAERRANLSRPMGD